MSDTERGLAGERIADESIYLTEDRYEEPKEAFKLLRRLIEDISPPADAAILDVGCATGELLHYIHRVFPEFQLNGTDASEALVTRARTALPQARFTVGRFEEAEAALPAAYDICTASGVMCCLDDPAPALASLLTWLKPGGTALVFDAFNEEPIDVVVRYRRADERGQPWETGWNIFARDSIARCLESDGRAAAWSYVPFRMPFALPRRDDPMRTYTIATEHNPFQLVNGASQFVDLSVLVLQKKA